MKFVAEQKLLADWLQHTATVADEHSSAEVFNCVRLDAGEAGLALSAINSLFSMVSNDLPLTSVKQPGSTSTPAARLAAVVAKLRPGAPVEITHEPGANTLRIKSGRTNVGLMAINAIALPVFVKNFPAAQLRMTAAELDRVLAFTAPAMGNHPDKASLWGVALNYDDEAAKVYAAACNVVSGAVACLDTIEAIPFPTVLLPRPLVPKLRTLLKDNEGEVAIAVASRGIRFVTEGWTLTSKLVDGVPPPHRRWMPPRVAQPIILESAELKAIVARFSAAVEMDNTKLKQRGALISFADQALHVRDGKKMFEDLMAADFDGDPPEIGVNIQHIGEALTAIGAEEVELHLIDRDSPIRLCAAGDGAEAGAFLTTPYRI